MMIEDDNPRGRREAAGARDQERAGASGQGGGTRQAPKAEAQAKLTPNMLPGRRGRRSRFERLLVRVIATGGVVGIGVAIAAVMTSNHVQGWIIGLVVALVSIILSALLWSSRQL